MAQADDPADGPPPETPKSPRMDLDFDEPGARRAASAPVNADLPAPTMDGEPVSLRDLEMIFAPGVVPPPMAGAPPRKGPPPLPPPGRRLPAGGTPIPSPRDNDAGDLRAMAALNPGKGDAARAPDSDRPPDSRVRDLRSMSVPPPVHAPDRRVDEEVLNLSGGIFDTSLALSPDIALAPPMLSELAASPASERPPRRDSGKPPKKKSKRPGSKSSSPPPKETLAPTSVSSASPKKQSLRPRPAATAPPAAAPASGAQRWLLAFVGFAAVVGGFLLLRGRDDTAPPAPAAPLAAPPLPPPPLAPTPAEPPVVAAEPPIAEPEATPPTGPATVGAAPTEAPTTGVSTQTATGVGVASSTSTGVGTTIEKPPPAGGGSFDKSAASVAMSSAAASASGCRSAGDPSGQARVSVTFAPSGRATSANVQGPPFAGTATGGCIARVFRQAQIPSFAGDAVTVQKTVTIH